ncbi:hypothetical protein [Streptomyces sp. NBC_00878]|uniref:hypothetical protein n=1 Tax=Streptomyces sp. NBC_00878 TaxID=2975854 RepID=UPI00225629B6|nr:hypothetical protein [Streptomyces sp. NBC_00878]MCX4903713.1 hypothetical protein [Streptomyces sp. NBC_00878]
MTRAARSTAVLGTGTLVALSLLTACGGGTGGSGGGSGASDDDGVASIASPSTGTSPSGASPSTGTDPDTGRPQLRLDTSDAETARLNQIFFRCLYEQGVPGGTKPGSTGISVNADIRKYPAAYKACKSKWPLQPPELDQAKNPHYMDDYREYIRCLNAGGLKVKALPDGGGWNYDGESDLTEAQQHKLDRDCELKAYK